MRMSQDDKARSHARIVASAARLFRERGLGRAGVAEVMRDAGMTHGGFYKHFPDKDALAEAALASAFAEFAQTLHASGPDGVAEFAALYLSRRHLAHPERGCPVAALGAEVARGPAPLKAAFGAGVRRVVEAIADRLRGTAQARRAAALRTFSMLVGAMVIARASDKSLAEAVLAACRDSVRR